jgi:hypothetical protein
MRFIDVLKDNSYKHEHDTIVDITNVAHYAFNLPNDDLGNMPSQAIPWPSVWLEYSCPTQYMYNGKILPFTPKTLNSISKIGFDCRSFEIDPAFVEEVTRNDHVLDLIPYEAQKHIPRLKRHDFTSTPRFMDVTIISGYNKIVDRIVHLGIQFRYLDESGTEVGDTKRLAFGSGLEGLSQKLAVGYLGTLLFPLSFALVFMHCKNVSFQIHEVPKKVARKRIEKGKNPGVSYKTLVIEPMKKVLKHDGKIEHTGIKKALHITRGHFATYSEDKPLFGKHKGTFWKPMHTRGSLSSGKIEKTYRVNV